MKEINSLKQQLLNAENSIEKLKTEKQRFYFSVYRDSGGDASGKLMFPKVVLNMDEVFNVESGTFKAPVKGVYTFTISGQQGSRTSAPSIYNDIDLKVLKNNEEVFNIMDDHNSNDENQNWQNLSYKFELLLEQNDEIYLSLLEGDYLNAGDQNCSITFSGELITKID